MEFSKILKLISEIYNIRFKIWHGIKKFVYKLKYKIDEDTAEEIVKKCNSKKCDKEKLYKILELYLLKCSYNPKIINQAKKFSEDVKAKYLNNVLVITTSNQYKLSPFIIFVDIKKNEVLLAENNLGAGIVSVRLLQTPSQFKHKLIEVKYISATGTGLLAHNIKLFLVSEEDVFSVLDKTIFEFVSGWNVFKGKDTVKFEQKYSFDWKDNSLQIMVDGSMRANNKEKGLPCERYVYDEQIRNFKQLEGRKVTNHLLSEVYGDLAQPKGDWFVKPEEIKENYSLYDTW